MAVERILLRSHQRDLLGLRAAQDSVDSFSEQRSPCKPRVLHPTIHVAVWVARSRAEFAPEQGIANLTLGKCDSKRILVESGACAS